MSLQIIKYGTKVLIADGTIPAYITGICIRDQSISYEVSYFRNGALIDVWIKRFQFEIDTVEKQKAGLVNYDKPVDNSDSIQFIQLT